METPRSTAPTLVLVLSLLCTEGVFSFIANNGPISQHCYSTRTLYPDANVQATTPARPSLWSRYTPTTQQKHQMRMKTRGNVLKTSESSEIENTVHALESSITATTTTDEDNAAAAIYRAAFRNTAYTIGAAGAFGGAVWLMLGQKAGEEFFAGYLVEQSLSVDNLFVFLILFEFFQVPIQYQNRVLKWGILGALVMRFVMIGLGAAALENFHSILLGFATVLIYSSVQILQGIVSGEEEEEEDMNDNNIVKFSRNLFDSTDYFDGDKFFTVVDGIKKATPLLICLVAVEISDVVFAVDSIPAVFGVTEDPFIVFTSNIFAITGLRSLYTVLSEAAQDLKYLEPAVAVVLGFIGAKMIAEYFGFFIPIQIALSVVAVLLGGGIGLSVFEKQARLNEN